MDIHHLKTFIAIDDHGTFGAAGKAVGLSQSAVSQQIRSIEDYLKVKLFDRTARPPVLTAHGITLLEGSRKIVREYERITSSVAGDQLSGSLVLGAIRTSFSGVLPISLAVLRDRYPHLRIHVNTADSIDLASMVTTGRLDAAIIPDDTKMSEKLCWRPYTVEPLKVIVQEGTNGETDKELLENSPYIRFKRDVPVAHLIDDEIRRRKIQVTEEMHIDSFAAVIRMVSFGLGVGIVPEQVADNTFPKNIRAIPFGNPPIQRRIGVIHRESCTKIRIVEALYNQLWRLSGSLDAQHL